MCIFEVILPLKAPSSTASDNSIMAQVGNQKEYLYLQE